MILLPPMAAWLRQGRELRDLKAAYAVTIDKLRRTLGAVSVLEQREEAMQAVLAAPCPMCEELTRERDDALLRLDAETATRVWIEGTFMGGTK